MWANSLPTSSGPASPLDGLADNDKRVYDALPARGARTADEIAVASGLPPTQVLGPLAMLEISGSWSSEGAVEAGPPVSGRMHRG